MTSVDDNPSAANVDDEWLAVDPSFLPYKRIKLCIGHLVPLAACVVGVFVIPAKVGTFLAGAGAGLIFLSFVLSIAILAPRSYLRMKYCLRELDINLQRGYLFWKSASVPINRVQHVEVNQGPIQRKFGISVLSIYTAGSTGSDMKIPGLLVSDANQIKSRLLANINAEELIDDAE